MAIMRTTRFDVPVSDADEMITRRNVLVAAVRKACPGLTEARLTQAGDETWIDAWRWDSTASLDAAQKAAASGALPEAAAVFGLATNMTAESAEIVDER